MIISAGSALLLAGCDKEKYSLRFSHNLHVTENGMDCADCHGAPGQPHKPITHETCADCHDEVAAEQVSAKTCGLCHEEKQLPSLKEWKPEPAATNRTFFVHTEALAGKCQDCHGALLAKDLESVPMMTREDVVNIRNSAHASGQDCQTCHVDMAPDRAPPSHSQAWLRRHGQFGMQSDAACSVCHSEESCTQCHSSMQPVSHNNLWRLHTHGTVAGWDRSSCMVCHQEDSCQSCHENNKPATHTARWAAPGFRPTHCIGCHNTSSPGDGCATCHEGGNDIMLHEAYWGNASYDHNTLPAGTSCYVCHWSKTP